jgi:hypothetical protein
LDAYSNVITFHGATGKDGFTVGGATRANVRMAIGQIDSGAYGMRGYDGSGNTLFEISETQNLIAGWTIGTSAIEKGNVKLQSATNASYLGIGATGYAGGSGIFIGQTAASTYKISAEGTSGKFLWDNTKLEIQGQDGTSVFETTQTGATIGGFRIDNSEITGSGGKLKLKASGQISGSTFKFGDNLAGSVAAARYGDATFNNFVYSDGTNFNIQTETFNLNTSNIVISSSNNGVVGLGNPVPAAYNDGTGFYADGNGNFLVGKSDGSRMQFDQSNSKLIISSSDFIIGSAGSFISGSSSGGIMIISASNFIMGNEGSAFISGSDGNIQISSSKFHLQQDGSVTLDGTISASAGNIGTWGITATTLTNVPAAGSGLQLDAGNSQIMFTQAGANSALIKDGSFSHDGISEDGFHIRGQAGQQINISTDDTEFINISGRPFLRVPDDTYTFGSAGSVTKEQALFNAGVTLVAKTNGGSRGLSITTHEREAPHSSLVSGSSTSTSTPYMSDDNVNCAILMRNNRGVNNGLLVGGYATVNDKYNAVALLAESHRNEDMKSSAWSACFRTRPMIVGNPWVAGDSSTFTDGQIHSMSTRPADWTATLIAYPFDAGSGNSGGSSLDRSSDHGGALAFGYGAGSDATESDQYRGRVAIGKYRPDYKLDVNGDIRAVGNVIAYSDRRHKQEIETVDNALDKVLKMRGVYFRWKDSYAKNLGSRYEVAKRRQVGVIAQEIEEVLPEVVFDEYKGTSDDECFKNVDYGHISGVLIEAIKEQQQQIEELKEEVNKLKENK